MSAVSETDSEVAFFLGAGASVKAGVPDTFGLVDAFKRKITSQPENLRALNKILEILNEWNRDIGDIEEKTDIELLLETIERLENKDKDILLKFFKTTDYALEGYTDKRPLKDELKDFVKEAGIVAGTKIRYMEPLLGFLGEYSPLDIFSVNYDICVEQFCNIYRRKCVDGFDITWNPRLFEQKDADIRLYKLHGSITWYRTDRGDYTKLPIMTKKAETELITGEKATTLILYPMRKWEYAEPLLELLMELKKKIESVKFLFVVGYSFRDDHITRIFWDGARKNKDLTVIFVSPNAHHIYRKKLKDCEIPRLLHGFSSDFSSEGFDAAVPSELAGRVLCLPYKFENVLVLLKNHYLKNLKEGLLSKRQTRDHEIKGQEAHWEFCLKPFVECEYMEKVDEILSKIDWNEYQNKSWQRAIEIAFKSLLNCIVSENATEIKKWFERVKNARASRIFSIERLRSQMMREPAELRLGFSLDENSYVAFHQAMQTIQPLVDSCNLKVSLLGKTEEKASKVSLLLKNVASFYKYLAPWEKGGVSFGDYAKLRESKYPELIGKFRQESEKYLEVCSGEQRAKTADVASEVEQKELRQTFGGSCLFSVLQPDNLV